MNKLINNQGTLSGGKKSDIMKPEMLTVKFEKGKVYEKNRP